MADLPATVSRIPRNEEFLRLIRCARRGGARGRQAITIIINSQTPLVKRLASKILSRPPDIPVRRLGIPFTKLDIEDLIQEGLFGVWRAIQTFDEGKGVLFYTWARRKSWSAMMDYAKTRRAASFCQVPEAPEIQDSRDADGGTFHVIPDHRNGTLKAPQKHVAEMLRLLSRRQSLILRRKHGLLGSTPQSFVEIAALTGKSAAEVKAEYNTAMVALMVVARRDEAKVEGWEEFARG